MNKILIIEDDKSLNEALVDKCNLEGFEASSASNGEAGLEIAIKEKPDLILLDIVMPVMDGLQVIKKLREDEWGKTAEIILLTNIDDIEKVSEAVNYGVDNYLVKSDLKMEEIMKRIKGYF